MLKRLGGTLAVVALVMIAALPVCAQTARPEATGAGEDVNVPVAPGLESRTPSARELTEEDVRIYIPHEEQLIGRVTIPDDKLATVVQPEGRNWRAFRTGLLLWFAAAALGVMLVGLSAFYLWRGTIRLDSPRSGRSIERFNGVERFAHWTAAISFIALAVTGLIVTFGRYLLIPVVGHEAFTAIASGSKYLHNFSSVPFVVGIALMAVLWVRGNVPTRSDLEWVRQAGGLLKRQASSHPETGRFNAGQKAVFWMVVLGGTLMAVTGYMLLTPFAWTGVSGVQIAHVIHAVLAALMTAAILGHIYIGTIGMEGAFEAMGRGRVDETWAIEHHRGWYEERRRAEAPPGRPGKAGAD